MYQKILSFFTGKKEDTTLAKVESQSIFLIDKEDLEDFYSSIKFKNGEEVFAKVAPSKERDKTILLLSNPIVVTEINTRKRGGMVTGYKVEPWMKTTNNDLFVVNIDDILTLTESNDVTMIQMYEKFIRQDESDYSGKVASRKMGYLSNVDDAKKLLEKLYNNS